MSWCQQIYSIRQTSGTFFDLLPVGEILGDIYTRFLWVDKWCHLLSWRNREPVERITSDETIQWFLLIDRSHLMIFFLINLLLIESWIFHVDLWTRWCVFSHWLLTDNSLSCSSQATGQRDSNPPNHKRYSKTVPTIGVVINSWLSHRTL